MTREELKQLYFLNREILRDKQRLSELKYCRQGRAVQFTGMPCAANKSDFTGNIASEISDLEETIEINLKRCWREINRINQFINSIDDSELRLIISLRHINCLSWQEIAFHIGYTDESTPRKRYERFMRKEELKEKAQCQS